jgi:hypothetical protein
VRPENALVGFGRFMDESLALLADEGPRHLEAIARALGPVRIGFEIDAEDVVVLAPGPRPHVQRAAAPADVGVRTTSAVLLGIVDGDDSLGRAILEDRVAIRGRCDDVLACDDALRAWAHGAIRAPSFSELLNRFRAHYASGSHP